MFTIAVAGFSAMVGFVLGVAYFFALALGNHLTTVGPKKGPGPIYKHLKRGSFYEVVGRVRAQASTTPIKDGDMLVLYVDHEGQYSARLPDEFYDGRFQKVV